ncbi:glycoside hydrolase family 10 protein [Streptomyces sp. NPDC101150]|uniref:glycoside hydrolase family 10 protein n=1 Tax=Streptomyces sp. NPDC101150 TaxID=3366114 RepID=UPI0038139665
MRRITRRGFAAGVLGAASSLLGAGHGTAAAAGATGDPGTAPMRGMWLATVANLDWPTKPGLPPAEQQRQLLGLLEVAVERRLNTVFFQVRPTADALWPSPHEPWAQYLTGHQGKDPGWDPLGFAVAEAHRRDLQLHAWFNPYRIANHADPDRLVPGHPARLHPEWVLPYGGKLYYNPGLPEVRGFVQEAMLDAVRRYPVDGVHFDDYFYPYPVAGEEFEDDAAFEAHGAGFADRASWRRDNVDRLVREMKQKVAAVGRPVRFGVSPSAIWRNRGTDSSGSDTRGLQTYDDLYADTRRWVREGWIDYIVPQVYWNIGFEAADYAKVVPWWSEAVSGTGVDLYIGEALYRAGDPGQGTPWLDPAELSRHLTFARGYPQVGGHVFFSARDVARDRAGALARIVHDHYGGAVRP